jgi:hypothetical protein
MSVTDPLFGVLEKDDYIWSGTINVVLFGAEAQIELIVEGNDRHGTIREEQREAFARFKAKQSYYMSVVEDEIMAYHEQLCTEKPLTPVTTKSEMANLVTMTGLVFKIVTKKFGAFFGFLLECQWDEENGLAVQFVNDCPEVGSQDLLT